MNLVYEMNKKILLPYKKIFSYQYVRPYLDGGFNNYIMQSHVDCEKWGIISHDTNTFSNPRYAENDMLFFYSKEDAMNALDSILISNGFKLLNNENDAEKYRVLL